MEIPEFEENVWIYDLSAQALRRLTVDGSVNLRPVWAADGQRVAFLSNKDGAMAIYWQLADGGGLERLSDGHALLFPYAFSPDGQLLVVIGVNPFDVEILRLNDHRVTPLLEPSVHATMPQFSPDGHWLAYASDVSGRAEVYVRPYPGPDKTVQISSAGGTEPVWTRNGRELVYRDGEKMMAVDIATQPILSPGKPHVLFSGTYTGQGFPSNVLDYDVSADGEYFVMTRSEEQPAVTQINIVLNWFEEVKQKAPVGSK
jgi:serine/threonine-protein kinase